MKRPPWKAAKVTIYERYTVIVLCSICSLSQPSPLVMWFGEYSLFVRYLKNYSLDNQNIHFRPNSACAKACVCLLSGWVSKVIQWRWASCVAGRELVWLGHTSCSGIAIKGNVRYQMPDLASDKLRKACVCHRDGVQAGACLLFRRARGWVSGEGKHFSLLRVHRTTAITNKHTRVHTHMPALLSLALDEHSHNTANTKASTQHRFPSTFTQQHAV